MDLQGNQVSRIEDLNLLRKYVCCVTELDLRGNPMAAAPSYMPLTLRRLPHLAMLDGHVLTRENWESAAASHGLLTLPLIQQHAFTRLNSIWSHLGTRSWTEHDSVCSVIKMSSTDSLLTYMSHRGIDEADIVEAQGQCLRQ